MFGPTNGIAQSAAVRRATLWAKEDIYDPDRLFLLGVLLYLQGDERAVIPLETGLTMTGGDHFRGFLAAANTNPLGTPAEAQVDAQNPGPEAIDQTPAPPAQDPMNPNPDEALPPLPLPAEPSSEEDSTRPLPSGPEFSLPNR
jgi:hypothetical protein